MGGGSGTDIPQSDMDAEKGTLKEEITWRGNIAMYSDSFLYKLPGRVL